MKITPPSTPPPPTPPAIPKAAAVTAADIGAALLARFKPGQTLTATVAGGNSGGSVPINIDGKLLEVTTPLQLMAGMKLQLRIDKGPAGEPLLRLLELPPKLAVEQALQQALKRAMPQQAEIKPLLQALASLAATPPPPTQASTPPQPAADLGQQLHRAAFKLMQALPEAKQLSEPRGLKQALADSGLFLEQKLAKGDAQALPRDLKGQLLRLLAQLTQLSQAPQAARTPPPITTPDKAPPQSPPPQVPPQAAKPAPQAAARAATSEQLLSLFQTLARQGESALSRIQFNQLQSMPRTEADSPEWLLELPVRHTQNQLETVKLRIRREGGGGREGGKGEEQWNIRLDLEDGRGGPLRVVLGLSRERVRVDFRAENGEVAEALSAKLGELEKRLRARGLEVGHMACHQGASEDEPPPRGDGLLREEA